MKSLCCVQNPSLTTEKLNSALDFKGNSNTMLTTFFVFLNVWYDVINLMNQYEDFTIFVYDSIVLW